jgi:hypothetical protein
VLPWTSPSFVALAPEELATSMMRVVQPHEDSGSIFVLLELWPTMVNV